MYLRARLDMPSPDRVRPKLQARAHSPDRLRQFRRRLVIAMRIFLPRDEQGTGPERRITFSVSSTAASNCGPDFGAMVSGSPKNVT